MKRYFIYIIFTVVFLLTILLLFAYTDSKRGGLFSENILLCSKIIKIENDIQGYDISYSEEKLKSEIKKLFFWDKKVYVYSQNSLVSFKPCNLKIIFNNEKYDFGKYGYSNDEFVGSVKDEKNNNTFILYIGIDPKFLSRYEMNVVQSWIDVIVLNELYNRVDGSNFDGTNNIQFGPKDIFNIIKNEQ